jgi:hypothetical protein
MLIEPLIKQLHQLWASPEIPDLNQGRLRGRFERRLKLIWRPITDARV